ncbi:MAG: DMT(drug/metabolite transporter) superfamily permease [Anaerolineaceae bacterium]|nr:MAG: DMT(drug/metabolite transporter) superfamily permease [Anaerolineaceae bacterium]
MKPDSPRAIAGALFAVIAWGASFVATKIALRYLHPDAVVWLRFAMGVVILGAAVALRRQFRLPERKDWPYLALLGFLGITFHQWLQSTALVTAQATTTGWIVSTIPVFMALLGWLVLKERLRWLGWAGILLSTFGVLMVVTRGDLSLFVSGTFGTAGDFLVLVSALNWAVFSVLSRRGLEKYPATLMMFYVMAFGWLFSSVLFFAAGRPVQPGPVPWDGWAGIAFLGIFCSGLAYIFWYDALQSLPVAQTGAFLYLEPMVTVIVAAIILGEELAPVTLLGGALILAGVWMVNRK